MKWFALLAVVVLPGCANPAEGITIYWKRLAYSELQVQCAAGSKHRAAGCYQRGIDSCVVYTSIGDDDENDSLGHEVRHCFTGRFH